MTNQPDRADSNNKTEKTSESLLRSNLNFVGSLKFAVTVLLLITLACIAGTLLPQGGDVQKYIQHNPGSEGTMKLLGRLGLTRVYSAGWFIGLLVLFTASLLVCTFRRAGTVSRLTGKARGRAVGSVMTHISLVLIFAGGVMRAVWGTSGYLGFRQGETRSSIIVDGKQHELPFSVHLVKFETERYKRDKAVNPGERIETLVLDWKAGGEKARIPAQEGIEKKVEYMDAPGGDVRQMTVRIKRKVVDFVIDSETKRVENRSNEFRNPAILVETVQGGSTNSQWIFAKYPDFNMHAEGSEEFKIPYQMAYDVQVPVPSATGGVKDWKSTLRIVEDGMTIIEKTIEVNDPLTYKGYTFYQSGFNQNDPFWTSLQVVKDPGVPVVYTGFALMIIGMALVFYLYPAGPVSSKVNGVKEKQE